MTETFVVRFRVLGRHFLVEAWRAHAVGSTCIVRRARSVALTCEARFPKGPPLRFTVYREEA